MKKQFVIVALVFALLIAVLPFTALAGAPATIKIEVRNNTGGEVKIDLVDASGNHSYDSLVEGNSELPKVEGVYTYYAQTVCGPQTGVINVSMQKTLYLSCEGGVPFVKYDKCEEGFMFNGLFNPGGRPNVQGFGVFDNPPPPPFSHPDHGCYFGITAHEYGHGHGKPVDR